MANLRIVPRNFHDEATVTASEAASGFPATNTQNDGRDTAWRSSTTGTVTIDGTFSRNRVINVFGMFHHVNHGGSIRFQGFTDAAWTTGATGGDTGTVSINKVVGGSSDTSYAWGDDPYSIGQYDPLFTESPYWYWFASNVTIRSYRITLSSHSSAYGYSSYWQISRLFLGKYWSPRINPSYDGSGLTWNDNTDSERSRGGSLRANMGARWREMKMQFNGIDEDEAPVWMDIMAYAQRSRAVMVSLFPEEGTRAERDNTALVKFTSLDVLGRQVNRLTKNMAVSEI